MPQSPCDVTSHQRSYNYPHVTIVYWSLYRVGRNYGNASSKLVQHQSWEWYLHQAVNTTLLGLRNQGKERLEVSLFLKNFYFTLLLWMLTLLFWNENLEDTAVGFVRDFCSFKASFDKELRAVNIIQPLALSFSKAALSTFECMLIYVLFFNTVLYIHRKAITISLGWWLDQFGSIC